MVTWIPPSCLICWPQAWKMVGLALVKHAITSMENSWIADVHLPILWRSLPKLHGLLHSMRTATWGAAWFRSRKDMQLKSCSLGLGSPAHPPMLSMDLASFKQLRCSWNELTVECRPTIWSMWHDKSNTVNMKLQIVHGAGPFDHDIVMQPFWTIPSFRLQTCALPFQETLNLSWRQTTQRNVQTCLGKKT